MANPIKEPRDPAMEQVVGWFLIGFKDYPDHEYPFQVKRDGTILPELELDASNRDMFYRYLADPEIHHVRFVQHDDREIEHDPWKTD